jgi:large subunit ribosomal protein L17
MRHNQSGRKLSRRSNHRHAMLRNLAMSLVKSGRLKTTDAKAKELRPFVEKLVTFARRGDLHARRIVLSRLGDALAVKKLFDELGPRFKDRNGGYTRILKLGYRLGDNSPVSLIEFIGNEKEKKGVKKSKSKKVSEKTSSSEKQTETEEVIETEKPKKVKASGKKPVKEVNDNKTASDEDTIKKSGKGEKVSGEKGRRKK